MSKAVYVCEKCNYRGTTPLIHSGCKTQLVYINRENTYCPGCNKYTHGLEGPCGGCGAYLGPQEVHYEPLD